MSKSTIRSQQVLKEIRRRFLSFRRDHGGKRSGYPKAIKELALSGLEQDCTHSEVALAAGVSVGAIRLWRKSLGTSDSIAQNPRPVELKLIQSRQELSAPPSAPIAAHPTSEAVVHIEFRSGARMTVPASAVSERWLNLLMGDAS
jgi:hypothetical protein